MSSRYYYTDDDDDGDRVLKDGEVLRVNFMDSHQRDVRYHFARDEGVEADRRSFVNDRLAAHNATVGHRPGRVLDALIHAEQPTVTVDAVSDDLVARRGTALADAMLERQRALAEPVAQRMHRRARRAFFKESNLRAKQQPRQLSDIHRDPSRLVAGE